MPGNPYQPEAGSSIPAHTHIEGDVTSLLTDLGLRLKTRGAWATSTAYALQDVVTWKGGAWLCTTAHTSSAVSFDSTKWLPLSSRGRQVEGPAKIGGNYVGALVDLVRTSAPNISRLYLAPAYAAEQVTIDSLNVAVSAGVATATHRVGIYLGTANDNVSPLCPNTFGLLAEAGVADCSTTGTKVVTFGTAQVIPADTWFWLAGASQTAVATLLVAGAANAAGFSPLGQQAAGYNASKSYAYFLDSVTGALPATVTTSSTVNIDGGVGYHRSA